jgi:phosphatidate phosphatase APP1
MSDWKERIENLLEQVDDVSDRLKGRAKKLAGYRKPLMIIPYLGYGRPDKLTLKGRVLDNRNFEVNEDDSRWQNLVNMYRRFETDEVPNALVKAKFQNSEWEVFTDEEGYFDLEIYPQEPLAENQQVELELINPVFSNGETARSVAQVIVPPETAKLGIISDIDDTVLQSNITNKLKMFLTVALLNEHTRVPFEGVAAFYKALINGGSGNEGNPIFYVSSSPWNLYTPLIEFLKVHEISVGPLFLKDFGNHTLFSSGDHQSHKMNSIEKILETFPNLPFVLIGDSGEKDPEIYREVVKKFPDRIRVIYIRSINLESSRISAIDKLIKEVSETGCQLVLAPDTEFAAVHAAAEGLISTDELANIRSGKAKDESAPSVKEFAAEP